MKKRPLSTDDKVYIGFAAVLGLLAIGGLSDIALRGENSVPEQILKFFYPKAF